MTDFQPGLQTHFPNGRLADRFLDEIRPRVYWHRADMQEADEGISRAIYDDIMRRRRQPLVIVWSSREVWFPGAHYEYQNERSINLGGVPALPGDVYRRQFDEDFYPAVKAVGGIPYYGAAANFETRDLNWYRAGDVQTLPPDVRFTIHDYYTRSSPSLQSRLDEWRSIIGPERLYFVSECGAQGLDDATRAVWTRNKFQFWSRQPNCLGLGIYQIFDDPEDDHDFGLYTESQQLKPGVFEAFPLVKEDPVAVSTTPLFTFDHAAVIHNDDGTKSLRWDLAAGKVDASKDRVFSLQPDGRIEDRADTAIGPWERGTVEGDRLVFRVEGARAVFAWQS